MTEILTAADAAELAEHEAEHPLIPSVEQKLGECETVIERGLQTFVEVGEALALIRDFKLYRFTHYSFHEYLKQRWDISASRAYQMIDASRITREMSTIVDTLPATESQARELVGLNTEQAAQVMRETVNRVHGKITAKKIRETRERIACPPEPKPESPPAPSQKSVEEKLADDEHACCGDENYWRQQALAAWDANPGDDSIKLGGTVALRFRNLLERHIDCWDPYVLAGQWASWLDCERDAPGAKVLSELAEEIGLFFYRETKRMLGGETVGVSGGDTP